MKHGELWIIRNLFKQERELGIMPQNQHQTLFHAIPKLIYIT